MSSDTAATAAPTDPDVMAAIEGSGPAAALVIADVSTDDAWISMRAAEAAALPDWR